MSGRSSSPARAIKPAGSPHQLADPWAGQSKLPQCGFAAFGCGVMPLDTSPEVEPDMPLEPFGDFDFMPWRAFDDAEPVVVESGIVAIELAPIVSEPMVPGVIVPGIEPVVDPGMPLGLPAELVPAPVAPGLVDWAEATVARPNAAADIAIILRRVIINSFKLDRHNAPPTDVGPITN